MTSRLPEPILLTGATGYVGGRLLTALESREARVRCLTRNPDRLRHRLASTSEAVPGDVQVPESLTEGMRGIHTAYYLVHAMAAEDDYAEADRRGAANFAAAARAAGVRRIIYLGGLGEGEPLSEHLASRQEVGRILRESGVPTVELRASIVLGSGSLSFEMIRALVERLPVMITPRWVETRTQPIGIEDLIAYLVEAATLEPGQEAVYEVGGPDPTSYGEIMREYARQRGLRRVMLRVPFLSPRLSSLWLTLVTPVYARVGRELIEGLRNETVITDPAARSTFQVRPAPMPTAVARALVNEDRSFAATRWSDALSAHRPPPDWGGRQFGRRLVDSRAVHVARPPDVAFRAISRIGGKVGWYYGDVLWRLRGMLDRLAGGPGLRRGRRDPEAVAAGDPLDFWRVEKVEPGRLLRLAAEMRLPGRAWLQFEVTGDADGSEIRQTAEYDPAGLAGLVYWYALWPIHQLVFSGMLRGIARAAAGPVGGR